MHVLDTHLCLLEIRCALATANHLNLFLANQKVCVRYTRTERGKCVGFKAIAAATENENEIYLCVILGITVA